MKLLSLRAGLVINSVGLKNNGKCLCSTITRKSKSFVPEIPKWDKSVFHNLDQSLIIVPDFINEQEETSLCKEVQPHLQRLVYEKDHWDEAIVKFRETERKNWNKANTPLIERLRSRAFDKNDSVLPYVHVLDLAEDGHIKPHIDSTRVRPKNLSLKVHTFFKIKYVLLNSFADQLWQF